MHGFVDKMPEYKIVPSEEAPFSVEWEELIGWFIIPRLGEKLQWAMYDFPERTRSERVEMEVVGKASIHGVEGVEIVSVEHFEKASDVDVRRAFVAQLTRTHCRILAESHSEGGMKRLYTFLDADDFLPNWGFGEGNCGKEVHVSPKDIIKRTGGRVTCPQIPSVLDVTGRYSIWFGSERYDAICVMDIETYDDGVMSETYLDQAGRTVLWRRFNRDDWAHTRYNKTWTEMLPDNERVTINGKTYVHWYDCVTDRLRGCFR